MNNYKDEKYSYNMDIYSGDLPKFDINCWEILLGKIKNSLYGFLLPYDYNYNTLLFNSAHRYEVLKIIDYHIIDIHTIRFNFRVSDNPNGRIFKTILDSGSCFELIPRIIGIIKDNKFIPQLSHIEFFKVKLSGNGLDGLAQKEINMLDARDISTHAEITKDGEQYVVIKTGMNTSYLSYYASIELFNKLKESIDIIDKNKNYLKDKKALKEDIYNLLDSIPDNIVENNDNYKKIVENINKIIDKSVEFKKKYTS